MIWADVEQNWASVCKDVKCKWGKFTDEDLVMIAGQRDSFVRLFTMRYSRDKPAAEKLIDAFVEKLETHGNERRSLPWIQRCWAKIRSLIHVAIRR